MSKMIDYCLSCVFFSSCKICQNSSAGSPPAANPTGVAYDAPSDSSRLGRETPLLIPFPPQRLRHLDLGALVVWPPTSLKFVRLALQSKRLGTPAVVLQCSSRGGKVFPGPATFGRPRRCSKTLKMVFQVVSFWTKICIKSIFGRGAARWGSLRRFPEPLVRWWGNSPHVSSLSTPLASRSQDIQNRGVIEPHDNVFRAPLWLSMGLLLITDGKLYDFPNWHWHRWPWMTLNYYIQTILTAF